MCGRGTRHRIVRSIGSYVIACRGRLCNIRQKEIIGITLDRTTRQLLRQSGDSERPLGDRPQRLLPLCGVLKIICGKIEYSLEAESMSIGKLMLMKASFDGCRSVEDVICPHGPRPRDEAIQSWSWRSHMPVTPGSVTSTGFLPIHGVIC